MVIIALLLECWKQSANLARLHRMCGSGGAVSRAAADGAARGVAPRAGAGGSLLQGSPGRGPQEPATALVHQRARTHVRAFDAGFPAANRAADQAGTVSLRRDSGRFNPARLWAGCAEPVPGLGTRCWGWPEAHPARNSRKNLVRAAANNFITY